MGGPIGTATPEPISRLSVARERSVWARDVEVRPKRCVDAIRVAAQGTVGWVARYV
jgi:hypothetical protein